MRRTYSRRNLFPPSSSTPSSGSMSSSSASGSANRQPQHPPPPPGADQANNININNNNSVRMRVANTVAGNAIVIVATPDCCMCFVVKHLLEGMGVNPRIFEVDEADEAAVLAELSMIDSRSIDGVIPTKLPAICVGGKVLGGIDEVMSAHIMGEFVPMLKEAGAIWL